MTEYLYVRYPEQQWQKFITTDTNKHQKDLIDKFIQMDTDSYEDKVISGIFTRTQIKYSNKNSNNKNSNNSISYIYYYTSNENENNNNNNETTEFVYMLSEFAAYINRLVD